MIAFLVGAGATLAEAIPGHPNQSHMPPLDATFFSLCDKARLEGRTKLRRYLTSHYGLDPFGQAAGMEEVFNIVYADAQSGTLPDGCLDAYWALLGMYREAIRLTTNRLAGTSRSGVGALLRFFARRGEREFTFITFNQDLVIEKAIEEAKSTRRYASLAWDIGSAYQVSFVSTHRLSSGRRQPFHAEVAPPTRPIRVLKLHGSMNWVYRVRSAEDAKNALRSPGQDFILLNEQSVLTGLYDGTGARKTPLLPFVIPPVYEKSTHIRDFVQPAWQQARDTLRTADELVVFGYSCPTADQAARNMIKNGFHQNSHTQHVHIIDPNPATASRIASLLRAPVTTQYRCVADFVLHYRSA